MRIVEILKGMRWYILILGAAVLLGCGGGGGGSASGSLTIGGDAGAVEALEALAAAFSEVEAGTTFNFVSGGDSTSGVESTTEGSFDLGGISRPLKATEAGAGVQSMAFAMDRVLIIVNPGVPVAELTSQQIQEVFTGLASARNLENWSSVGGPDSAIDLFIRDEAASATGGLRRGSTIGRDRFAPWAQVLATDSDMMTSVANGPNAIGYVSYSAARRGDLSSVKVLLIDGQDPEDPGSDYPLSIEISVAYLPDNAAKLQPFLDFITTLEAQELLSGKGLEPIN